MRDARPWSAGVLSGALGVLCFSGTAPASRAAAPVFGSATLTFARIAIAALLALITLVALGRLRRTRRELVPALLAMGLGLAIGFPLFLALAVERVPASHAAVVLGLAPAATAALSVLRTGERPPRRFWGGCASGLTAVVAFAVADGDGSLQPADMWLLAAVLSVAVGYVEGGRVAQELGGTTALCLAMILLAPLALIGLGVSLAARTIDTIPVSAWIGIAYAGIFSMFIGSILWYRGLAIGGVARIGQLNLAQPLLAVTWAALLLGEHVGWEVPLTAIAVLASLAVCLEARQA